MPRRQRRAVFALVQAMIFNAPWMRVKVELSHTLWTALRVKSSRPMPCRSAARGLNTAGDRLPSRIRLLKPVGAAHTLRVPVKIKDVAQVVAVNRWGEITVCQ